MALLMDYPPSALQYPVSEEVEKLMCNTLLDQNLPIGERFRALSVRFIIGSASRNAFIAAMKDPSILLAYNAAHELGRMQDFDSLPGLKESIPALEAALNDLSLHPIVRHKAAESLGAFGLTYKEVVPILKHSLTRDPAQEVRETCELALTRLDKLFRPSFYTSIVPPPSVCSIPKLREILMDEDNNIHERHVALFALQELATEEAMSALIDTLGSKSALLRHGVAYVLCLLNDQQARDELSRILQDTCEHPLVRLQAAKFFGYAEVLDDSCTVLLNEFVNDRDPIVSQSCEVALARLRITRSLEHYEMEPTPCVPEDKSVVRTSMKKEQSMCDLLLDQRQAIWERFRAFSLWDLSGPAPRGALIRAMWDASSLLACNAANYLGRTKIAELIPVFEMVLVDLSLHPIVRHEAAEALGLIGSEDCLRVLLHGLCSDPAEEVRETCYLSLRRIEEQVAASPLYSARFCIALPAVPTSCSSIRILREVLLDENECLYYRHAALFTLAVFENNDDAISAIIEALSASSILLRSWVAYALSTICSKRAIDALCEILKDTGEHLMVRQQAVRGLEHVIDDPDVIALLEKFAVDPEPIVSQSCEVARKRIEFKRCGEPFQIKFEIEVVRSGKAFEYALEAVKQVLEGMKQVNLVDNCCVEAKASARGHEASESSGQFVPKNFRLVSSPIISL